MNLRAVLAKTGLKKNSQSLSYLAYNSVTIYRKHEAKARKHSCVDNLSPGR